MSKYDRLLALISRARQDLDSIADEVTKEQAEPVAEDEDLLEVRARIDALETRVHVIEERGHS